MATQKTYAEKMRVKLAEKAAEAAAATGFSNELEFVPEINKPVKIRILPPIDEDDPFFYRTHSYHFVDGMNRDKEEGKGFFLWSKKKYVNDGKNQLDPFDKAVQRLYDTNDDEMKKIASKIKRKRHFFFNILLVDESDPEKKFKVLIDTSNEGKLTRVICAAIGVHFCRDTEDEWYPDKEWAPDSDKTYADLFSFDENGHDFKIVKKSTGINPWDISYEESFAIKKGRTLSKEEMKVIKSDRIDLAEYKTYEEDYNKVNDYLETYLANTFGDDVVTSVKKSSPKKQQKVAIEDEEDENEITEEEVLAAMGD